MKIILRWDIQWQRYSEGMYLVLILPITTPALMGQFQHEGTDTTSAKCSLLLHHLVAVLTYLIKINSCLQGAHILTDPWCDVEYFGLHDSEMNRTLSNCYLSNSLEILELQLSNTNIINQKCGCHISRFIPYGNKVCLSRVSSMNGISEATQFNGSDSRVYISIIHLSEMFSSFFLLHPFTSLSYDHWCQ